MALCGECFCPPLDVGISLFLVHQGSPFPFLLRNFPTMNSRWHCVRSGFRAPLNVAISRFLFHSRPPGVTVSLFLLSTFIMNTRWRCGKNCFCLPLDIAIFLFLFCPCPPGVTISIPTSSNKFFFLIILFIVHPRRQKVAFFLDKTRWRCVYNYFCPLKNVAIFPFASRSHP